MKSFDELDHPCKGTCSGWQQGFEKGARSKDDVIERQSKFLNQLEDEKESWGNEFSAVIICKERIQALEEKLRAARSIVEKMQCEFDHKGLGKYIHDTNICLKCSCLAKLDDKEKL